MHRPGIEFRIKKIILCRTIMSINNPISGKRTIQRMVLVVSTTALLGEVSRIDPGAEVVSTTTMTIATTMMAMATTTFVVAEVATDTHGAEAATTTTLGNLEAEETTSKVVAVVADTAMAADLEEAVLTIMRVASEVAAAEGIMRETVKKRR